MAYFWATFEKYDEKLYRFDTRIYLNDISEVSDKDICIGAVVGKNPGSAMPRNNKLKEMVEIDLNGDKLLPTIRNIIAKTGKKYNGREYIQVLNLFYLCDPNLDNAINEFQKNIENQELLICNSEKQAFPWIWFLWGGYNSRLNKLKDRFKFKLIKTNHHFFLNHKTKEINETIPSDCDVAKHTQGMKHDLVIPYLKKLLS